jgi:hypothetical protein
MIPKHVDPRFKIGQIVMCKNKTQPSIILGITRITTPIEDQAFDDAGIKYNLWWWTQSKYAPLGIELSEWGWIGEDEITKVCKNHGDDIPDYNPADWKAWDKLPEKHREWYLTDVVTQGMDVLRLADTVLVSPYAMSKMPLKELPPAIQKLLENLFTVGKEVCGPDYTDKFSLKNYLFTPPNTELKFDRAGWVDLKHLNIKVKCLFDHESRGIKCGDVVTITKREGVLDDNHNLHFDTPDGGSGYARNWQFMAVKEPVPVGS